MNIEDLASFSLQRVTAYEGLAIDAATWTAAHAYHQTAQRLHVRALHGWGIVTGLEAAPVDPPARGVIVQPGLALDAEGNSIRIAQPVRLAVPQPSSDTACVVLRFAETPVEAGNGNPPSRVNEIYTLSVIEPPLRPTDIELARVRITDPSSPIRGATDEWAPDAHEIDGRFRRQLRLPGAETLVMGQLALAEHAAQGINRQGLVHLTRELHATAPFMVQFLGDMRIEAAVGNCHLLYLNGAGSLRLTPREGAQLLAFLRGGGILFAEPSVQRETEQQENGRFVASFQRLLADLKHDLEPIGPEHPIFSARHIFALPPEGLGGGAPLLASGNVFLNPNDYGACWQGGLPGKPLAREVIRAAIEFGVNLAWYAADSSMRPAPALENVAKTAEPVG